MKLRDCCFSDGGRTFLCSVPDEKGTPACLVSSDCAKGDQLLQGSWLAPYSRVKGQFCNMEETGYIHSSIAATPYVSGIPSHHIHLFRAFRQFPGGPVDILIAFRPKRIISITESSIPHAKDRYCWIRLSTYMKMFPDRLEQHHIYGNVEARGLSVQSPLFTGIRDLDKKEPDRIMQTAFQSRELFLLMDWNGTFKWAELNVLLEKYGTALMNRTLEEYLPYASQLFRTWLSVLPPIPPSSTAGVAKPPKQLPDVDTTRRIRELQEIVAGMERKDREKSAMIRKLETEKKELTVTIQDLEQNLEVEKTEKERLQVRLEEREQSSLESPGIDSYFADEPEDVEVKVHTLCCISYSFIKKVDEDDRNASPNQVTTKTKNKKKKKKRQRESSGNKSFKFVGVCNLCL